MIDEEAENDIGLLFFLLKGEIMENSKNKAVTHENFMGENSYDINNPILRLRLIAASCYFKEPKYYDVNSNNELYEGLSSKVNSNSENFEYLFSLLNDNEEYFNIKGENSLRHSLEKAIDDALDFNVEMTLKEAVNLRKVENMRTTPQVIMVRAANHPKSKGTNLIRLYAQDIMGRADEATVQMEYQLSIFGKPIPNSLKKAWKKQIENLTEYQVNKYKLAGKKIKLLDVVNMVHAYSEPIDKLMKGNLKLSVDDTWEALISKTGSNNQNWTKAIELMSHTALLKNLRNFKMNNVDMEKVYEKLIATAKFSKMMPFHYYMAYLALNKDGLCDAMDKREISKALEISMDELPTFQGKVISLCDNSGSAHGAHTSEFGSTTVAHIANLSAILTAKNSEEGYVGVFGDKLKIIRVKKEDNVFDVMDEVTKIAQTIGQSTENGIWLFFEEALRNKDVYSNIFVYSDMQAGHGRLYGINPSSYSEYKWNKSQYIDVPKLIKKYRKSVNSDALFFLVQVAGYGDTLVPEIYKNTYIIGGWSAQILRFANKMRQINKLL